ncbi:MAG: hypothetical protein IKB23_02490, partial [Clostridia bacterium]|nr:hypothetical protein [Clostridia bacterium]
MPILLCTAALAAVVTAITVMKGTIISVETHDVFEYGQKLDLGGKAFFGRVRFEYSADNLSWTDEQPNMPGEYRARAFALDSFGNRNYGDEFAFVIKRGKLSIVCKENTLVYGDKPTPLFEGLAKGDTVKGVRFSVDSYHRTDLLGSLNESIATAVATPNIMNLDIVNSEGKHVTGAYDIDALPKQVNISRRSEILRVEMKSAKKVYDGLPLDSRSLYDITQGTLVDGDILLIEQNSSSIVDVQKLELAPANVTIYDSMRENVTFLYNIEVISATLEITPRPLYIETESAEFTYDGKLRTFPNYKILKGDLVYGDSLKILSYRSVKTVSEDGAPYKNEMYFSVVNSYGNEVSDNYDIEVDFGEITVNKCPITIATGSSEKEWDGRPLSNKEAWIISNTDLAVNHNVTISGNPTITMIGRTKNTCDESLTRITLSNGEVVTNNFIIQGYQYGTLNVKQGPQLCVMVYPTTKTYSGKKISVDLKDVCVPIAEGKVTIDYSHIN